MNEWDRDNLNFILTANEAEFEAFIAEASTNEINYALDLVRRAKAIRTIEHFELLESVDQLDCTEALSFINRVKKESL